MNCNCGGIVYTKGLCGKCYQRKLRKEKQALFDTLKPKPVCKVCGADVPKDYRYKSYCRRSCVDKAIKQGLTKKINRINND